MHYLHPTCTHTSSSVHYLTLPVHTLAAVCIFCTLPVHTLAAVLAECLLSIVSHTHTPCLMVHAGTVHLLSTPSCACIHTLTTRSHYACIPLPHTHTHTHTGERKSPSAVSHSTAAISSLGRREGTCSSWTSSTSSSPLTSSTGTRQPLCKHPYSQGICY